MKKKSKLLIRIISAIGAVVVLMFGIIIFLYRNEIRTLMSLEQIDKYGMYRMTYYGDYGFDEFLKIGASSDADIEAFVTRRLLKGLPIDLGVTGDGCTAFVTHNEAGEVLFGRNFDFTYSPSLQVYTEPRNGYASVSTVNLSFLGYSEDFLPSGLNAESFLVLAVPFLPFDGMNEKGVAIANLAVPVAEPGYDDAKVTLNTTTAMRLVLDKAATTDEAIELLSQYNMYFSASIPCHYLISDSTGHSVIVEYYDNGLQVVETDKDYQIASNFIAYQELNIGEGYSEFDRYDAVESAIETNGGTLEEEEVVEVLADVGIKQGRIDKLQWSVLYNLTTGGGKIFANRKLDHVMDFNLVVTDSSETD